MATPMDIDDLDVGVSQAYNLDDDEVVSELDVYTCGGPPSRAGATYLLQFPQRTANRPYAAPQTVRLKPRVKRMQWEVPLDRETNWNRDAPPVHQLLSHTLQSSRVDPGVQGLAIGVRHQSALFLLPVSDVLQLRHSPAYLDKEKETERETGGARGARAGTTNIKTEDGLNSGRSAVESLLPIRVQVKRHETEQQVEARLRSYQHHSQQEESDQWIDLKFRGANSQQARALRETIPASASEAMVPHAVHPRVTYLNAIVPAAATVPIAEEDEMEDKNVADAGELGRPAAHVGDNNSRRALAPDTLAALPSQLAALFERSTVLSLDNIRTLLSKLPGNAVLNHLGETATDAALHSAVMASGDYLCIRNSYTPLLLNKPDIDPLRTVVLELLQEKEQLRRSDVVEAAAAKNISPMGDGPYQRVMKELCHSRGSIWFLKNSS